MNTWTKSGSLFVFGFAILAVALLLFVLLPVITILVTAGLPAIWAVFQDAEAMKALGLTFYAALWATVLAFIGGVPLAYLLARYQFWGKSWLEGLVNLPIVIPHTAAGIALLMVFGRQSWLHAIFDRVGIDFVDQFPGVVVGMMFVSLPFLVNNAREAFALIDPEIELVALADGANRWQAFSRITLPLAWRGVAAGVVMMWGRGISEFGAVVILAYHPKVIPVLVYERFAGFGLSAAQPVAVLLILASLLVFLSIQILLKFRPASKPS